MTGLGDLVTESYVSLTTFRKDGRAVPTPIWVVGDGAGLAVWTPADSGKIKRLRNVDRVTVQPCDARGNVHGAVVEAKARIGDAADTERVRGLIGKKYGVLGRLTVWASKLRRGSEGTVAVLITPAG